ncbi:MAG: adaptor protein MecA [Lachnospiraceae bacterium]|nr:adaptor protein MecA [Lachnospiraceae bacterium]
MKIEKVNDHQIRCTLTKSDLAERELKISELAYGTEKAKNLFRDMMQQAAYQFGFEAEDIPLMIEAIPLSGDTIVLIITKVEDPEELDTRFSKFAPSVRDNGSDEAVATPQSGADDVLDMFRKLRGIASDDTQKNSVPNINTNNAVKTIRKGKKELQITVPVEIMKRYSFEDLEGVTRLAHILNGFYDGNNSLYKDGNAYTLVVSKSDHSPEQFNKVCNIITEYARSERFKPSDLAYLEEHGNVIIEGDALQEMAKI